MEMYPLQLQSTLIMCSALIHNYIRKNQGFEDEFDHLTDEELEAEQNNHHPDDHAQNIHNHDEEGSRAWRDNIAQQMWNEYVLYCHNNHNNNNI